jgi:hypothetical protein
MALSPDLSGTVPQTICSMSLGQLESMAWLITRGPVFTASRSMPGVTNDPVVRYRVTAVGDRHAGQRTSDRRIIAAKERTDTRCTSGELS